MGSSSSSSSRSMSSVSEPVISSSSLSSISSIQSLTPEERASRLARKGSDDPLYYVVITPRTGDQSVLAFREPRDMIEFVTPRLERKTSGLWVGDILIFYGKIVEYTEPIMNYRINVPEIGELSVTDANKSKYTNAIPIPKSNQ